MCRCKIAVLRKASSRAKLPHNSEGDVYRHSCVVTCKVRVSCSVARPSPATMHSSRTTLHRSLSRVVPILSSTR